LIGKTNTPELTLSFETDNPVYGPTKNPYDLSRSPGGSSGGAAAIIAASGTAFDVGTDTAGSIRVPVHFCGIAGLKPTSGRVPRTGHIISFDTTLQSLTHVGPLARYVEDLELLLPILAGPDGVDPHIPPVPLRDPNDVDVTSLRVGFFTDNGISRPTRETRETTERAADALEGAGASVRESRPAGIQESFDLFTDVTMADGGAWIQRLLDKTGTRGSTLDGPLADPVSAAHLTAMLERLDRFRSEMLAYWNPIWHGRGGSATGVQLHAGVQSHRVAVHHRAMRCLSEWAPHRRSGGRSALERGRLPSRGSSPGGGAGRMGTFAALGW
jgi:amidase